MGFKNYASKIIFWAYGVVHPVKKKIVFSSFFGKQYSDNPRAISEEMHKLYPEYEIVWLLNNKNIDIIPDYVRTVSQDDGLFAWGKEISTAYAYVYNCELSIDFYKKKKQIFIQTWHGDRGVKKILLQKNPNAKITDARYTDICLAGSSFGINLYRKAFGYKGKIMTEGCPRNDCLLQDRNMKKYFMIKEKLNLPNNCKVLLFAPTFRDNEKEKLQKIVIDINQTLDAFPKQENWVCLIRGHVASLGLKYEQTDLRTIDVTAYPDMADLLYIADFLITDYSSCATDFAITKKPIIIALLDKEEYKGNREFSVDPEAPGFIIAHTQEELNDLIRTKTLGDYRCACDNVNRYYGVKETGKASESLCRLLHEKCTVL